MLERLLTEQRCPESAAIDAVSTEEALRIMNAEDAKVAAAVARAIPTIAAAVDAVAERVRRGGRLFYVGAGTSGRLGVLDASECPPTYGVSPEMVQGIIAGGEPALTRSTEASEDVPESGERDLMCRGFGAVDAVAGIAASGRTPYVLGAIRAARARGGLTVGISCTPQSELSAAVEIPIEVLAGPEVITGSTRMKAGTATKLVLNMLSTGLMVRLGYVYGNLMVNVQPTNSKLRDRAKRIIREATGVTEARAEQLLAEAGAVATAIVMERKGVDRTTAASLLERSGGVIRKALEL